MSQNPFKDKLDIITGDNIILRPITAGDTDDIVRWRNDPEVQKFFIFREPFTREMHCNWLETKVETGKVIQYMIIDKADGKSVGSVYLKDVDRANESAEYGIFIGESSARGRGIGSEAARIFTDFAFAELDLHRISLRLLSDNVAARRSYENAGFVKEGCFSDMVKVDGRFVDIVFMAKLKEKKKEN